MRRPSPGSVALAAVVALDLLLLAPHAAVHGALRAAALSGEVVLLTTLVIGASRLRPGVRRAAVAGAAAAWTALWTYEVVALAGHLSMGQEPLLFDLTMLVPHLLILTRDLLGGLVYGVVAAACGVVGAAAAGSLWAFARLSATAAPRARWLALAWAIALLGPLAGGDWPARWVVPDLVANARDSAEVRARLLAPVRGEAHAELETLDLQARPDLALYIVESYGMLLNAGRHARPWGDRLQRMEGALREVGWHAVSGASTAPVSGGRSWIADASLLLGQRLQHEAEYRHAIRSVDRVPHLVGFLQAQGYHAVLVRPRDRARPGVSLQNHFGFDTTVFFDDLRYAGPPAGWGIIPDQYTLGFLHDEVLPDIAAPRFSFTHLATAHVPWDEPPPLVADWRKLGDAGASHQPEEGAEPLDQLALQLKRYRRVEKRPRRKLTADRLGAWASTVFYDLDVLEQELVRTPPTRPSIALILGDHQPPLLGDTDAGFDVPVHVLASDPALLRAFRQAGFASGMRPARATIRTEGLLSLLASALASADAPGGGTP